MTDQINRSQPGNASEMSPEVAEAIRIADTYLPGSPPEYRMQCAKEILQAIIHHGQIVAMDAIRQATSPAEASRT